MELDQSILVQGRKYRVVDQNIMMEASVMETVGTVEEALIFKQ